jgi:hypothetical protein
VRGRWILRSPLGGGHRTLGGAAAPTARAEEGQLRTLHAIHAPLITTSAVPTSTVGGVLAGPIVDAYTRLKYMSPCAAAQMAPAYFGRSPERQTATPRSTLPTRRSTMSSRPVSPNTVLAKMGGSSSNSSRPASTACPSSGAEKVETPCSGRNSALPSP